jgi:hypothetical protein
VQDDIERGAVQRWFELADEWVTVEARLADLHQRESMLEASRTVAVRHAERQLLSGRTSQNVAIVAMLLNTLPTPSTDGVGEVYRWLKNILSTTVVPQVESSLQHRVETTVLTLVHPEDRRQGAAQGALEARMASSLGRVSAHDRLSRPRARSEPQVQ